MSGGAILMMVLTMGTVTAFAIYYFVKVLRAPLPSDEPEGGEKTDASGSR